MNESFFVGNLILNKNGLSKFLCKRNSLRVNLILKFTKLHNEIKFV